MKQLFMRLSVAAIAILVCGVTPSLAQVEGLRVAEADAFCDNSTSGVVFTLTVTEAVPANIVGIVVEREVVGACFDMVDVGAVIPVPTEVGDHVFGVASAVDVPGHKVVYYVRAVDDVGDRHWILWPQRTMFAQADCGDSAAAAGLVTEALGYPYLEICPVDCWWGLSVLDNSFPIDQPLPPLGSMVKIFGDLKWGMEGNYIDATHWEYDPIGCSVVGNEATSWSSLKAHYR